MLRVTLAGQRSLRTPFAYPAYQKWFRPYFEFGTEEADVFVFGMCFEIPEFFSAKPELLKKLRPASVWLVSEEPLWDTVWNQDKLYESSYQLIINGVTVQVNQISHFVNSPYAKLEFPYFPSTNDNYFYYYQRFLLPRLHEPRGVTKPEKGVALLEFRANPKNDILDSDGRLIGLSNHRSRLAQYLRHKGLFRVSGRGWSGKKFFKEAYRQDADDFHLQKLEAFNDYFGYMFALENTLQANYVSEKAFDALACGSVPLYYADNEHDIRRYIGEAFINTMNKSFSEIASDIRALGEAKRAALVHAGVSTCAKLFTNFALVEETRRQVTTRIAHHIMKFL